MKMPKESLEKLLALLIAAKSAAGDAAEPSVTKLLDESIYELQQEIGNRTADSFEVRKRAWIAFDSFIRSLPRVSALIDWLSG